MSSWLLRRANIPPCTAGCRVLTRPSKTSGCPVTSDTSVTSRPASLSVRAVPPVDRIAQPMSESDSPNSAMPSLSHTLSSARGCAMWMRVCDGLEEFVRGLVAPSRDDLIYPEHAHGGLSCRLKAFLNYCSRVPYSYCRSHCSLGSDAYELIVICIRS